MSQVAPRACTALTARPPGNFRSSGARTAPPVPRLAGPGAGTRHRRQPGDTCQRDHAVSSAATLPQAARPEAAPHRKTAVRLVTPTGVRTATATHLFCHALSLLR